jgi:7-keto-8-aminopelargonate synthetase-like enzyme
LITSPLCASARYRDEEEHLAEPDPLAAALEGLKIIRASEGASLRSRLWENINLFSQNLNIPDIQSAILPWVVGSEAEAVDIAHSLETHGYLAPATRYPTVAKNKTRIRFTLRVIHTREDINQLTKHLARLSSQVS